MPIDSASTENNSPSITISGIMRVAATTLAQKHVAMEQAASTALVNARRDFFTATAALKKAALDANPSLAPEKQIGTSAKNKAEAVICDALNTLFAESLQGMACKTVPKPFVPGK